MLKKIENVFGIFDVHICDVNATVRIIIIDTGKGHIVSVQKTENAFRRFVYK